jgi:hypothetical protein
MENKDEIKAGQEGIETVVTLRLWALNLQIDPKNPERKPWRLNGQSFVNGINAVPIISYLFALNDNWNARKEDMEKQTAMLEPLQKDGELLKKIEKNLTKNVAVNKAEFAKSAVNILSNDSNKDLLTPYLLTSKYFSGDVISDVITKALKDVNEAKHRLLTGEGRKNFITEKTKPEEVNKELIEFLGYKTKGETNLMSSAEIAKTMTVLEKDFGFTLENDGTIKYEKPKTLSENYQKELETANNINNSKLLEGLFDYSKQNDELETQKAKEAEEAKKEANNTNYSRTSTGETPQSGMSAEKMVGNVAVLGGAAASAALIPLVGWIVALAILYSFKDKFKDNPEANEEFKNAARSNGLSDEKFNKLQNEFAELKNRELNRTITPKDVITKDLAKYLGKNPDKLDKITSILEAKDNKEELKEFLEKEVYGNDATDAQKAAINNLLKDPEDLEEILNKAVINIKENQEKDKDGKKLPNYLFAKENNENTKIHQSNGRS